MQKLLQYQTQFFIIIRSSIVLKNNIKVIYLLQVIRVQLILFLVISSQRLNFVTTEYNEPLNNLILILTINVRIEVYNQFIQIIQMWCKIYLIQNPNMDYLRVLLKYNAPFISLYYYQFLMQQSKENSMEKLCYFKDLIKNWKNNQQKKI
ncbi:hypothetical protein pb186bvf_020757 [Paramecium bursaria]